MNILVATLGSYGDVYPMVGLAVELKRRGHAVTLFTNPFFDNLARQYHLDFVPIGTLDEYAQFASHPALFDPRAGISVFFRTLIVPSIRSAYERLLEGMQPGKTVIVSSITVFASRLIQEKHGVPMVTVHVAPLAIKSAYEMPKNAMVSFPNWLPVPIKKLYWWVADRAVVDRMICPELNAFRKELRLPPVQRILTKWGHSPQRVICLFPSWYCRPQPDWPPGTCTTGFPLFDEGGEAELAPNVKAFLEDGEPPVVFMPGSLMQQARRLFEVAIQSCQDSGKRAMLLSRYVHQIPNDLPENVRHFEYIPFRRLLPCVGALVHHGGIGTCAQALKAGVPQLIHPMAYDQYDNAWRLRRLGVGDWLTPKDWQVSALTQKLRALTSSSQVRERCQDVAGWFRGREPLTETCELIEAMPLGFHSCISTS